MTEPAGHRVAVVTGGAGAIGGAVAAALTGQTLCTDGGLILR
jgi:hypothetical protein